MDQLVVALGLGYYLTWTKVHQVLPEINKKWMQQSLSLKTDNIFPMLSMLLYEYIIYIYIYIYIYIREKQIFLTANKHQIKDERESDHPPKRTEKNSELQLRIKFTTLQVLLSYWNSMQG